MHDIINTAEYDPYGRSPVSRPLKVVHLVEDLKVGGLEKIIATLALSLNKQKYSVEVWCLSRGGDVAELLRRRGVKVRIFSWHTYHNPLNLIRHTCELRKSQVDIVHTHGYYAGTFSRLAAIAAGVPRIFAHVHTTYDSFTKRHFIIEKCLSRFTSRIICVSHSVKDFVVNRERIRDDKTCVVYNGADWSMENDTDRQLSREDLGLADRDCVVVSVGSLVENKGHMVLLRAADLLSTLCPPVKVLIVGDGPERTELEAIVSRNGLSSMVIFTGILKQVQQVLAFSDIAVLTSIYREGLSLAVLEAMNQQLPVIVTRIGGLPEAVDHNKTGLLVPANDPQALACAIRKLAKNKELRKTMGVEGKKKYDKNFKTSSMVAQIESIYESA